MRVLELLGFAGGALIAPFAAAGSYLRRARVVHPDGVVYRAEVTSAAPDGPAHDLALRLVGPALVRMSAALWRRRDGRARKPDILGAAIRFRSDPAMSVVPDPDDQDLLFATFRSPFLALPALLGTDARSYLFDDYFAVALFEVPELGLVRWRLRSPRIRSGELTREEALEQAVHNGEAVFELQVRDARMGARYEPVAHIRLTERVHVDQAALRFSPFRSGRHILARGLLNALRILPYPASQLARPMHD